MGSGDGGHIVPITGYGRIEREMTRLSQKRAEVHNEI
jgi:hypothetical protein